MSAALRPALILQLNTCHTCQFVLFNRSLNVYYIPITIVHISNYRKVAGLSNRSGCIKRLIHCHKSYIREPQTIRGYTVTAHIYTIKADLLNHFRTQG